MAGKPPSWRRWRIQNQADHAQYLDHWLAVMKADKKAIFTAASKASEAGTFLSGLQGAHAPCPLAAPPSRSHYLPTSRRFP
jgi:antirestriction protein ArdC